MPQMLYIIGAPGSGKTTSLAKALEGCKSTKFDQPFAHLLYGWKCSQLGAPREMFGGTDVLPMNVQPIAEDWLKNTPCRFVVAEGDRLGNGKFFQYVLDQGWDITVAFLDTPEVVCKERRAARGSNQDENWLKGRRTKVANLARTWVERKWIIDGCGSVEQIAAALRRHPVIKAIREVSYDAPKQEP